MCIICIRIIWIHKIYNLGSVNYFDRGTLLDIARIPLYFEKPHFIFSKTNTLKQSVMLCCGIFRKTLMIFV